MLNRSTCSNGNLHYAQLYWGKAALLLASLVLATSCINSGTPITERHYPPQCEAIEPSASLHSTGQPALLALSGGGYRAMLFHLGALWRLNEIGVLSRLRRVSSVSGGTIVAGVLAANWKRLNFDENGVAECFRPVVVDPTMDIAGETIDTPSILVGLLTPSSSTSRLRDAYAKKLFGELTLQDLPRTPGFVFNSTNLQTGAIWRFSRRYLGDGSIGVVLRPSLPLADVVTASSAYPPILSPLELDLSAEAWLDPPVSLTIFDGIASDVDPVPKEWLADYRRSIQLSDGGIADNLGLESIWNHRDQGEIFVSDGGGGFSQDASPRTNWLSQTLRVIGLIHGQPSQLRTKILLDRFRKNDPDGVYWSIQEKPAEHSDVSAPVLPTEEIQALAAVPTRLAKLDTCTQQRLINWGYVAVDRSLPYLDRLWKQGEWEFISSSLPFPDAGFGPSSGSMECS